MTLQVLVAAMHQNDFTLYKKMKIKSDAVIANQCERNNYEERDVDGKNVKLVSTNTRGVGKNRNIALIFANADIVLFSAMDILYAKNYEQTVLNAFRERPDADGIIFHLQYTKGGRFVKSLKNKNERLHLWNTLRYGTERIAVRYKTIKKYNLHFSELFGGGCLYGSGEDSIFLMDMIKAGCRLYSSDKTIGECSIDSSTWFKGYNQKYMYDKGAFLACSFPKTKSLVKYYFPYRLRRECKMPFWEMMREINRGIRGYDELVPYADKRKR